MTIVVVNDQIFTIEDPHFRSDKSCNRENYGPIHVYANLVLSLDFRPNAR